MERLERPSEHFDRRIQICIRDDARDALDDWSNSLADRGFPESGYARFIPHVNSSPDSQSDVDGPVYPLADEVEPHVPTDFEWEHLLEIYVDEEHFDAVEEIVRELEDVDGIVVSIV